jgi:dTDP-4-dehydrorhamnose 3,5-epimerase
LIEGVSIRELRSNLDAAGFSVEIWENEDLPGSPGAASCRAVFPGSLEAWAMREKDAERIICLQGMIKLVLCDRRGDSPTREEVMEIFLGEYRFREVIVPPGVLRGWKAAGGCTALVLLVLEGEGGASSILSPEEAAVPYDWDIVMQ